MAYGCRYVGDNGKEECAETFPCIEWLDDEEVGAGYKETDNIVSITLSQLRDNKDGIFISESYVVILLLFTMRIYCF